MDSCGLSVMMHHDRNHKWLRNSTKKKPASDSRTESACPIVMAALLRLPPLLLVGGYCCICVYKHAQDHDVQ
jgi:hypothetical protein